MRHHRDVRQARRAQASRARRRSWPSASARTGFPACARRRVAEKHTSGLRISSARSAARAKRSPTTEPIEPPMKAKSKAQATSALALQLALHRDQRVALAGGLLRGLDAVGILLLVLELQHVGRAEGRRRFPRGAAGIEEAWQPHARADRHVVAALGADLEVFLELGPVQHRAAAVALFPQALGHAALAAGGASVRMRAGISFFSQLIGGDTSAVRSTGRHQCDARPVPGTPSGPACSLAQGLAGRRAQRATAQETAPRGRRPRSSGAGERGHQRAADHHAVGVTGHRGGGRGVLDAEAGHDRHRRCARGSRAAGRAAALASSRSAPVTPAKLT